MLAKQYLTGKRESEILQYKALTQALDNGNIIAEKDSIKKQVDKLKIDMEADSLLIAAIDKHLQTIQNIKTAPTTQSNITITEQNIQTTDIVSPQEEKTIMQQLALTDSIKQITPKSPKYYKTLNNLAAYLYYRTENKLDSTTASTPSGATQYLTANAKAYFSIASKLETEAQHTKDIEQKQVMLQTAAQLKTLSAKNITQAYKLKDDTALYPPVIITPLDITSKDKQKIIKNIAQEEALSSLAKQQETKIDTLLQKQSLYTGKKTSKLNKQVNKLKQQTIKTYTSLTQTDTSLYSTNEKYINKLLLSNPPQNTEECIAHKQYAEKLFNKATHLSMQAEQEQDIDQKLSLKTKAHKLYKQAIESQNTALNLILFDTPSLPETSPQTNLQMSPMILANELSQNQTNISIDNKKIWKKIIPSSERDNWLYTQDNDKEEKDILKNLNEALALIEKNNYDIKNSKNPSRIKTAQKDNKYLKKTTKTIINDLTSLVVENEKIKQDIIEKQINTLQQENQPNEQQQTIISILQNKATEYNKKADEILNKSLKETTNITLKAQLAKEAKAYKEKATNTLLQIVAIYKGLVPPKQLQLPHNQTNSLLAIQNTNNSKQIIEKYQPTQKPASTTTTVITHRISSNQQAKTPIPQSKLIINIPTQMIAQTPTSAYIMIDTFQYVSLAKLKISFPSYINISITNYPQGCDTLQTDSTISFVWLSYNGNTPKNITFSITPQNILPHQDTISVQFSYLVNNNIAKITKPIPINFEVPQIAENSQQSQNTITPTNNSQTKSQTQTNNTINQQNITTQTKDFTKIENPNNQNIDNKQTQIDTTQNITSNNTPLTTNIAQTKSQETDNTPFITLQESYYNDSNPIPINPPLPNGIIFKIQIGAYFRTVNNNKFKVKPISIEKQPGSRYYKYMFGQFNTYEAAFISLQKIKGMGYPDAFIVAYKDGKRIPLYLARQQVKSSTNYQQLAKIETQAVQNNTTIKNKPNNIVANLATLPTKSKLYTVQIGVFRNTPSQTFLSAFPNIYIEKTPYGFTRYFSGVFNSYNEATKERNRAIKLGVKDAFVVLYKNGQRLTGGIATNKQNNSDKQRQTTTNITQPVAISDTASIWFGVQIGAFKGTANLQKIQQSIQAIRNNEITMIKSSPYTYLIAGKFKSFAKAQNLATIIKNEGIKDAFVVAIQGNKKVNTATARKLLKQ